MQVRCRDDTVPKTVEYKKALEGRVESMRQSSATSSLHLGFLGVAEDCRMLSTIACSAFLYSTVFGTVSSLHLDFYIHVHAACIHVYM